jgi:hypothetical protein
VTPLGISCYIVCYFAGLDYTVAHYGIITSEPRLDCVLSFVNDTTPEAADGWAVGEVGGFEAYLLADEEEEGAGAAAVYRQVKSAAVTGLQMSAGCAAAADVLSGRPGGG